jgi:phenylacetyl-CoA:acceptor oxidoreductase subunit 2
VAVVGPFTAALVACSVAYRRAIGVSAPRARAVLDNSGRVLQLVGTLLPLASIALIAAGVVSGETTLVVGAIAGIAAAASGSQMKYTLVVRAGFTQGFALAHLPVRGVRP